MADRILVLGGYGVFGGRLARRLVRETSLEILVAGRSLERAAAHCQRHGGTPLAVDRDGDLQSVLAELKPRIVIDAAGPFQSYGDDPYRVARAAIAAGAHYVDLADDTAFVTGIAGLDAIARDACVSVISGASTVPAISSAALDELTSGLDFVGVVGSAVLPGNRAPRGLSVVRAVVGQAGRKLRVWRGGSWQTIRAWSALKRFSLASGTAAALPPRLGSPIGVPDLEIFPSRYGARSVLFHAGLELRTLHLGLWLLAWPVRLRLVRSIGPLAGLLKWVADRLENFGSDRGGMIAYAKGRDRQGGAVERRWTLIAEAGDGPEVPATPALLIARKLLAGTLAVAGARSATGVLSLAEVETGLSGFRIGFERTERPAPPLMERVLARDFPQLPTTWRRLADVYDIDHFTGDASVERGSGLPARLIGLLFGFPPASLSIPVQVTKTVSGQGETWTRRFGAHSFVSHLSRRIGDPPGILRERFGPLSFVLRLGAQDGRVLWPVESWRFLGLPMPRALMPRSETSEMVDDQGRFRFDVSISLGLTGLLAHYRGWLEPMPSLGDATPMETVPSTH